MSAPISFTQGEDVTLTLTINDSVGSPIDISSDSFEGKIKDISDLAVDLASFAFVITDGVNGVVEATLTDINTLAIPATVEYNAKGVAGSTPLFVLFYDIYRTDSSSDKRRVADGLVTVYPTITYTAT